MADELRLEASVVDRFSKPLKDLRDRLRDVKTPDGVKAMHGEFAKVESAVKNATKSIQGGLGQAMAGLSIPSLTAVASIGGVIAAVKGFSAGTIELKQFSRETGITIEAFKTLKHAASQFGVSEDAIAPGLKNFAGNLEDFRRRYGETYAEILRLAPDLMKKLREASPDKAADLALDYLSKIPNRITAGRLSERLFGTDVFARFGARGAEALAKALAEVRAHGSPSDEDEKSAAAFAAAIENLQESFGKLGKTVGREVAPVLTETMKSINSFMDANKGEVGTALQESVSGIGKAFRETDWREIGQDVKSVGEGLHATLGALRSVSGFLDKYLPFLNTDPVKAGASSAGALNRFLSGVPYGAQGDLDYARRRLSEYDSAHPHGAAGIRGAANDPVRRGLLEGVRRAEEALKNGTAAGTEEGLTKFFQKQSFKSGRPSGGNPGIINASYGADADGGGSPMRQAIRRSFGGGHGADDNDVAGGDSPSRFGGGKTFNQKAPEVMSRLMRDFHLSREEAGAVLGNLGHESAGFRAFNEGGNGPGRGWAQWTEPGRKRRFYAFAKAHGLDIHSDEANYGFLKWELQHTHKGAIAAMRRAVGPEGKLEAFEDSFESARVKAYGSRRRYMDQALRAYDQATRSGSLLRQHREGASAAPSGRADLHIKVESDTARVSTKANGRDLFRSMPVTRGRSMIQASEDI